MPNMKQARGGKKAKNPMKTLGRLLKFLLKNYWPLLLIVLVCMAVSAFASVYGAGFPSTVVTTDDAGNMTFFADYDTSTSLGLYIFKKSLPLIIVYVAGVVAAYINARVMVVVGQGTLKKVRDEMFDHMQTLPIVYFDRHQHGEIMSRFTNDTDTLRQLITQSLPSLIQCGLMMIFLLIYMIVSNFILALVVIVMVVIMVFTTKYLGGKSGKGFVKQQIDVGELNGYVEEMLSGIKVVKVFNHEEESIKGFDKINNTLCESSTKANIFANILMPIMNNLGYISYGVTIMVGSLLALNSVFGFNVTKLIAYISYNRMFCNQVTQGSNQFNMIVLGLAGAERIFELMDEKSEDDDGYVGLVNANIDETGNITESEEVTGVWAWKHPHHDGTTTYTKLAGDVRFFDVDFGYYPEKIVLHDVSLFAKPGQKIAFVGSTGAGKTTITNLINRFYDIQDGKIRIDGININKIKKADLRRALGMVLQDTNLFTGTIRDNIRYGKLDATEDEILEAAKLANVDQFVKHLPNGFDTMLTENGSELSQGQRQLIAIARAAITNPPVLILDEATSSIDTRTEALVTDAMDKLMDGRTVFVIAHRLSTVKNSKAIMVLEHGVIIERGSHDELISQKGKYYQLYTGAFELE